MPSSPAYEKYPQHTLAIDDEKVSVEVSLGDVVIARSSRALALHEGRYPTVVYVPREDVDMQILAASDHVTHCPFKGDASYFDFVGSDARVEQIAWSYEDPFDQMLEIRGHLAFYADRAQIEILESQANPSP